MFKKISIILLIVCAFASIGWFTDIITNGQVLNTLLLSKHTTRIEQYRGYRIMGDSIMANPNTRGFDCIKIYNSSGGVLNRGDVVVWNQVPLHLVDTVIRSGTPETLTVAVSGGAENTPLNIASISFSFADAGTLEVTGVDWAGSARVESLVHTTDNKQYSTTYWDSLTQVRLLGTETNDSVVVLGYRAHAITTVAGADNILAAGVIYGRIGIDSVLDKGWGLMAYSGVFDSVKVLASTAEAYVGRVIHTSATAKKALPDATPVVGAIIGRLLESGNTDGYYKVYLIKE